ncbi:MAG: cell division protein FtsA, partial [Hyphomonadaceae bacterium]|nr:cell division protein FtsA [Hyphomonadaceae bacterium]
MRLRDTKRQNTFAVLDIGSSKVTCLIGEEDPDFGIRLAAHGISCATGIRSGVIVDMDLAENAVRKAVEKAERGAGMAIHTVDVNVSTRSLRSNHLKVQTEFARGEIADRDLRRVMNSSLAELAQPDYAILHAIPINWSVDGEDYINRPVGMHGSRLGVNMHFVISDIGPLRNLARCVERSHLQIKSVTASPYASGLGVLTNDERDIGATVIEMGGGSTSLAVFRDDTFCCVDTVGVGGQTVTQDVARGLVTPIEAAERIKLIYGSALQGADDDRVQIPCPPMGAQDSLRHEPRSSLTRIIRSRIEETFEILCDRMQARRLENYIGSPIVLTGGASRLNGVREVAECVFNKRVRLGQPHGILGLDDVLSGPDFAVAAGLLKGR